ncbi:MAG: enoyl-CoA hydratase [Chloroflexi bacterium]|nr:enoyl-CoA hydratase [Chloroflexota bacterium]
MTTERVCLLEKRDRIARITLNRPDRLNALNRDLELALIEAIHDVAKDDSVNVVILTGNGRAFCSGGDVSGLGGARTGTGYQSEVIDDIRRNFAHAQEIVLGIQRMEKPTIAMVNGIASGAGMDIACACDIRTGCDKTRFMSAYIRIGLFPGWGGAWLYPRVMGVPKAAEFMFTGDFLEADEAHRIGMLNKLVPQDQLESATMELARKIANGPPIALRLAKLNLYKGLEIDLETAMKFAAASETITLTSQDHREGTAAFREKRAPKYQGK